MNVQQMREHAREIRATHPKRAAMFDRFADRMENEQPTLKPAQDIAPGDLLQGVNGTAFLVTSVEPASDARGREVTRINFDGVSHPMDRPRGEDMRHWPADGDSTYGPEHAEPTEPAGLAIAAMNATHKLSGRNGEIQDTLTDTTPTGREMTLYYFEDHARPTVAGWYYAHELHIPGVNA